METICMKCQILFSGKNKKNISLLSAEFAHRVVKVKNLPSTALNTPIDLHLDYLSFLPHKFLEFNENIPDSGKTCPISQTNHDGLDKHVVLVQPGPSFNHL